ncbi:MAG: retroviral-like aspartic protease family protein [Lachnospiraceae bacterium]|nr:retroviral-like aspartic protease family protein [Lachnospiraceae bacterium]
MDFTKSLRGKDLSRIQFWVTLYDKEKCISKEVKLIVDTGNINTIISQNLVDMFSIEKLAEELTFTLGGKTRIAERHIIPYIEFSTNFEISNVAVESVHFQPNDELYNSILLGLNTLNNWDYCISNFDKSFYAKERFSILMPNKLHYYSNYFVKVKKDNKLIMEYSRLIVNESEAITHSETQT